MSDEAREVVAASGDSKPRKAKRAGRDYPKLKPGPGHSAEAVAADQRARIHGAMVELVAERGYDAVKVSDLVGRAHVSTGTFYERSHGKQECLLDTYDEIMRHAARRIAVSVDGQLDRQHARLGLSALADALVENPQAARFVCLDASAAGLGVLDRMREAERTFEAMVARCLPATLEEGRLRAILAKAIVAGLTQVFTSRLIAGRQDELPGLIDELLEWAFGLGATGVVALATLGNAAGEPSLAASALSLTQPAAATVDPLLGERELILFATIDLAAKDGYWQLSVPRIRRAAGLSRRRFELHFEGVEDCFVSALELISNRLVEFIREQSRARGRAWPTGFHRAVASLCAYAASDPGLARLALIEVLASGPLGLRHLSRLIAATAEQLRSSSPADRRPSPAISEAAMGAVWGIVRDCVSSRRVGRLSELSAVLSFLALSPTIGSQAAVEAIRVEETARDGWSWGPSAPVR